MIIKVIIVMKPYEWGVYITLVDLLMLIEKDWITAWGADSIYVVTLLLSCAIPSPSCIQTNEKAFDK